MNRRAAKLLVSPVEYVLAENVYGGNVFLIAEELGLPEWVVKAYQEGLELKAENSLCTDAQMRATLTENCTKISTFT